MKKCLLVLTTFLSLTVVHGQTNVSGGIFSNTTWTVSGSPYTVTGNIVVMSTVTLTIQPGVLVKFDNGTNMQVKGYLQAIGTNTDTIVFTSSSTSPTKGIWNGISFWNDLTVDYIKISYGTTALDNTYQKIININHSRISNNNTGLNSIGSSSGNVGYIDNSLFDSNTTAVSNINHANYITNSSFVNNDVGFGYVFNVLISNNTFTGHTTKAIDGYGADYIGNTFLNNNVGLRIKLFNSSWKIQYNIITNNQTGVQARGDATSTPNTNFSYNTICHNTIYNVENTDNVDLYMKNNCWCTTDSSAISDSIHDAYDNLALGVVYFSPFLTNCSTGVEELSEIKSINVFPNPFSSQTVLQTDNFLFNATLTVDNYLGQTVKQIKNISGQTVVLSRDNLPSGLYFVRLTQDNKVIATDKLVITD